MHRPILLLLIWVGAGLLAWAPTFSHADSHEIIVLAQSAESAFPDGIRFFIEAQSPDQIDEVRVIFKKIGQTSRSSYRAVEFEPGRVIQGESLIRSHSGGEYIPPGTRVGYYFELRDTGGRTLRTDEQVLVYLDDRFPWPTKTEGLITVFYDVAEAEARADLVLKAASESLALMGPILGIEPTDPLHIIVYSDYRYMNEALPIRAAAVERQLITQGMAFGNERVLMVFGGDANVAGTTRHEFTHLLVDDAVGGLLSIVPVWLNEGLAEYSSAAAHSDVEEILDRTLQERRLRPLWHLQTFSGRPDEIIDAYEQSLSVAAYLISTYGEANISDTVRVLKSTLDIDKALQQVYGFDQRGLDAEWRVSRGLQPLPARQKATPQLQLKPKPVVGLELPTTMPDSSPPAVEPTRVVDPPPEGPSCGAPAYAGGGMIDFGALLLLGGPLTLGFCRLLRRR